MSRIATPPHKVPRAHHARKHRHGHGADDELSPRRTPSGRAMKKSAAKPKPLRILMLMDKALVPPDSVEDLSPGKIAPFKTELDVYLSLKRLGHEVLKLGVQDDLTVIREAIDELKPHVAFNLLEGFDDFQVLDHMW